MRDDRHEIEELVRDGVYKIGPGSGLKHDEAMLSNLVVIRFTSTTQNLFLVRQFVLNEMYEEV